MLKLALVNCFSIINLIKHCMVKDNDMNVSKAMDEKLGLKEKIEGQPCIVNNVK